MKNLFPSLQVEWTKARRSRVPLYSALGITLAPVMCAVFAFILQDPERALRLGIIGKKAQLTGEVADWPSYLALLGQAVSVGGLLLFGLVAAWTFGREFADGTVRSLLALPTSRRALVMAKWLLVSLWCVALATWAFLVGLGLGALVGFPSPGRGELFEGAFTFAGAAALTIALQTVVALVGSVGRGYLAPVGWAVLSLFFAQILAATGWGPWFPWSVPALITGVAGQDTAAIGLPSICLVAVTSLAGLVALLLWWEYADHAT